MSTFTVSRQVNDLLGAGINSLDISTTEYNAVVDRYNLLGRTFDQYWEDSPLRNLVYPQGSFALGTVTRNIHRNDDIDIDLVVVRGLRKNSTTQSELKTDTGAGLEPFVTHPASGNPKLSESDRCWTLEYPGMHMDVLPAISAEHGTTILITDKNVSRWQPSDPKGFAQWFHESAVRELEARGRQATAGVEVDGIPVWRRKTNLQLAVQALKRHRDIYFTNALHRRPSSIVLTTLAALAYRNNTAAAESEIFDALRVITMGLEDGVQRVGGTWVIENPAMREENFADYWPVESWRPAALFEWIDAAKADFADMPVGQGNDVVLEKIGRTLGGRAKIASARALAGPVLNARQTGRLGVVGSSAVLTPSPSHSAVQPMRDHTFAGGPRE